MISENYYYRKVGDHATNQISTIRYGEKRNGSLVIRDSVRYAYDSMGNITKVYENGEQTVSYEYDGIGRLKRENNRILGKTKVYAYDGNGNILTRREYVYTVKGEEDLPEDYDEYIYGYEGNTDRLTEIVSRVKNEDGEYEEETKTFTYDAMGNPTVYEGKAAAWTKGRQLMYLNGVTFGYNGQGQRIAKTQGSTTNNFTYDMSGNLIKESRGVEYYYDAEGVCGMKYDEEMYFYRKDVFGNITEILDSSGAVVVRYRYDAWGNHVVLNPNGSRNESSTFIGNINPFRYRGYYYDTETKLYYLKTRYYDPETGRFITIDDVSYLAPDTINGLNLYAYCLNNPVMNVDPTGHAPKWWQWLIGGIGIALIVVAAGLAILGTGGVAAFGLGALIGSISAGVLGAGIGAGIGYASGGIDGLWKGALIGFGIGAAVGFAIGGVVGASVYSSALGTNFGKMGTVVKHPGIKVDWSKSMIHGPERMLQRGVTKRVVNSTVRRGIALSQTGGKFAFITQKAFAVVSSSGVLVTTYGKAFYDAGMLEIIKVLFGG